LFEEGGEGPEGDAQVASEVVEGLVGLEVAVEEVVEVDWCLSGVHVGKVLVWDGVVKGGVWVFEGFWGGGGGGEVRRADLRGVVL
jgi:hypothetical protein